MNKLQASNPYLFLSIVNPQLRLEVLKRSIYDEKEKNTLNYLQAKPIIYTRDPFPIALLFNSLELFIEFVENTTKPCVLVKMFVDSILEQTNWIEVVRRYIRLNTLLYLYLILLAPDIDILKEYVNSTFPSIDVLRDYFRQIDPYFDAKILPIVTTQFVIAIKQDLSNKAYSNMILNAQIQFYVPIFRYLLNSQATNLLYEFSLLGKIPTYLSNTMKKRIHLLSHVNFSSLLFKRMFQMDYPRIMMIEKERLKKEDGISFEICHHLFKFLPSLTKDEFDSINEHRQFKEFTNVIYFLESNNGTDKNILKEEICPIEYPDGYLSYDFILKQFIVFHMPNWKELWCRFRFPISNEIIKRLYFLKQSTKHQINLISIIKLFFGYNK